MKNLNWEAFNWKKKVDYTQKYKGHESQGKIILRPNENKENR